MVYLLRDCLEEDVIVWPSDEEHIKNIPECFQKYPKVRVVLDCTEVFVERPKCLNCRLKVWSFYKGNETLKILLGVAPSGLINFVSDTYGGRASDKAIFNRSDIFKYLIPQRDEIMADKGFDIEQECAFNYVKLVMPPFRRKKNQFSHHEVRETKTVASARVHIERKIQRMKIFLILKHKISWKLVPYFDAIVKTIAILANLQNPIMDDDKF